MACDVAAVLIGEWKGTMIGIAVRSAAYWTVLIFVAAHTGVARADTLVAGGTLAASTTWTLGGSPYVLQGDVTVPQTVTLTIEPGVEVRAMAFSDSQAAGQDPALVELTINGALLANGTADRPIVFDSSSPAVGSWYGIVLDRLAANVHLNHTSIQGPRVGLTGLALAPGAFHTDHLEVGPSSSYGVWLRAGTQTLDSLIVTGSPGAGVRISDTASATLNGCVIHHNVVGIEIAPGAPGSSVLVNGCTLQANNIVSDAAIAANSARITVVSSIIASPFATLRLDSATWSVTYSNRFPAPLPDDTHTLGLGVGSISANPLFVSDRDLRLTSNCATTGIATTPMPAATTAPRRAAATAWSRSASRRVTMATRMTATPAPMTACRRPAATVCSRRASSSATMVTGTTPTPAVATA